LTSTIFAIIVILFTPQGPKPYTPPFLFETKAECEDTRKEGDKRTKQNPGPTFISYCVAIGGKV